MKVREDIASGSDGSIHQERTEAIPPDRSDSAQTEDDPLMANILRTSSEMLSYDPYVSSVEELAEAALSHRANRESSLIPAGLLDGQAGDALRKSIPLRVRREQGERSLAVQTFALKHFSPPRTQSTHQPHFSTQPWAAEIC